MGALKINVSDTSGQSWPLVLHQTLNQKSTGWGPGIKFLNASDSSSKWAGIGGMASSGYANNNDLVFYTQAEARFRMNNNTFYPIGDAIYNLGGPTVRWANVYGVNFHGKADTVNTVEISSINDFNNFVEICRGKFHIAMLYGNKQLPEFTNAGTSVSGWMTGLICCQSDGAFSAFYHSHQSDKLYFASGSNGTNFTRHHQIAYLDQVLPLSGGTMSGALNFANGTWNKLGDDVQFGDRNKPGGFFIQGLNGTTNLTFTQYGGAAEGSISFDGNNFSISNYIVGTISNADTLDGYHADSFASASNAWRCGCSSGDANDHVFNGAWRTPDSFAHVPIGNGHLWTLNGDGAGNTCVQFSGTYNMSNIYYRSKWYNSGWTNWYTLLSSNNYNSYSPTLTGGGASGTWGINISGASATSALVYNGTAWGGYYADGDTHILQLGYFQVSSEFQSWVLCISSSFWGNQHSSSDFITVQSDTNGGFGYSASRVKIGGKIRRTFYLYKDTTNNRLYLYVAVYGGNSYGYWDISLLNSRYANSWVGTAQFNTTLPNGSNEIGEESFKPHTPSFGANQPSGSAPAGTLYYQTIG